MRQSYSHPTGNRGSERMNNLCTVGIIGSPDQFQSPHPSPTLHCPSFHQHPCHSAQSRSSSLETSFRACTFHFIKYTFFFTSTPCGTLQSMHIQSYLPKALKLVGDMEAEEGYSATREMGLSVTTEAPRTIGV